MQLFGACGWVLGCVGLGSDRLKVLDFRGGRFFSALFGGPGGPWPDWEGGVMLLHTIPIGRSSCMSCVLCML